MYRYIIGIIDNITKNKVVKFQNITNKKQHTLNIKRNSSIGDVIDMLQSHLQQESKWNIKPKLYISIKVYTINTTKKIKILAWILIKKKIPADITTIIISFPKMCKERMAQSHTTMFECDLPNPIPYAIGGIRVKNWDELLDNPIYMTRN